MSTAIGARAQITWTNGAGTSEIGGVIGNLNNWSPAESPGPSSNVIFGTPTTAQTISVTVPFSANDVTFSGAARPAYTFNGTGAPLITIAGNIAANSSSVAADVTFANTINFTLTNGTHTVDVGNAVTLSVAGIVGSLPGDTVNLAKTGGGTLALSGNNSFTGTTTINGGYVSITGDAALGMSPASATANQLTLNGGALWINAANVALTANRGVTVGAAGGAFNVGSGKSLTVNGPISGSGALTLQDGGTLILTSNSTYSGLLTNTGSILRIGDGIHASGYLAGNIANGGALVFNSIYSDSDSLGIYSGQISGGGTLEKKGSGYLYLSGDNTPGGGTTVTAGFLNIGIGGTTGSLSGNVTLAGGQLQFIRSNAYAFSGGITGTGNVAHYGGTLTLSPGNTYGGNTFVGPNLTGGTTILTDSAGGSFSSNSTLRIYTGAVAQITQNEKVAGLNDYDATPAHNLGSVTIAAAKTLTIDNGSANTFSGAISGMGSLAKTNPGTLTLQGSNTYAGSTTVTNGTLALNANGALPAGSQLNLTPTAGNTATVTVANGVSVSGGPVNFGGAASTTSALTLGTGSTFTLGGDVGYDATTNPGAATISGGTLALGASRSFGIADSTNATSELTVTSTISGTGFSLTKTGGGTLTLSSSNSYTGGTTLAASGGTLRATNAGALGTGALTINGGTLQLANDAATTFTGTNATVGGTATLASDRVTAGAGVTHTLGTLSIGASNLTVAPGSTATSGTAGLIFGATTLTGSPTFTVNANAALTLGAIGDGPSDFAITKAGAGTLTLTDANTYSGGTTLSAGTLALTGNGTLGDTTKALSISGGTLSLGTTSQTVGAVTMSGTGTTITGAGTLTGTSYSSASGTVTVSAPLGGTSSTLTKSGTGTLTLSGANTYGGVTTVSSGTLALSGAGTLGSGQLTITGGTLNLGSTSQSVGAVTLSGTSTVSSGTLTGASYASPSGTVTVSAALAGASAALTKSGSGTLTLSGANTYGGGTTVSGGTLALSSAGTLGANTAPVAVSGGTLDLNGLSRSVGALTLTGGTIQEGTLNGSSYDVQAGTISSTLSGSGPLTKSTSGTVTLSGNNSGFIGAVTLNAGGGTLAVTAANALGTGGVTLAGGNLQLANNANTTFSGNVNLTGSATITADRSTNSSLFDVTHSLGSLALGSQSLAIVRGTHLTGANVARVNFSSIELTGSGSVNVGTNAALGLGTITAIAGKGFTKQGAGNLILSGSNGETFGGDLTASAGTVTVSNRDARGNGQWTFNNDTVLDLAVAGASTEGGIVGVLSTGTTRFNDHASLLAKNSYAISDGTQYFNDAAAFTASAANVITGGQQIFTANSIGGDVNVASESFMAGFITLSDEAVGDLLKTTARLTVDRNSTSPTITGGTQTFNGYASLQANHTGAIGAGSLQRFYDDAHLRASKSDAVIGGTQEFYDSSFLWAKGSDAVSLVSGGVQRFFDSSTFVADSAYSANGPALTFRNHAGLLANTTNAIGSAQVSLYDEAFVKLNATDALTTYTNLSFNGASPVMVPAGEGPGGPSIQVLAPTSGGQLLLNNFSTSVGALSSGAGGAGVIQLDASGQLTTDSDSSTTYSGVIIGQAGSGFTKAGRGKLTLAGASPDFTGTTSITDGTLELAHAQALAGSTLNYSSEGGTLALAGLTSLTLGGLSGDKALALNVPTTIGGNNSSTTYGGALSGTANLTKTGTGTLRLTAASPMFTGTTSIAAGTLLLAHSQALAGSTLDYLNAGGTLALDDIASFTLGGLSGDKAIAVSSSVIVGGNNADTTYSGAFTGTSGSITKMGTGKLTLKGNSAFTGNVTVNAGTLQLGDGGTTGGLNANVAIASGATLISNRSDDTAYPGVLTGNGTIKKMGSGVLTLAAANPAFVGQAEITSGTVRLLGSFSAMSSTTISGGRLSGTGTLGSLAVNTGGGIAPGDPVGMLSAGATTFASGGRYLWDIQNAAGTPGTSTGWDLLSLNAPLTISATSANPFIIELKSLNGDGLAGLTANFNPGFNYTFPIVNATAITGFATNAFQLNTSGFQNSLAGGTFGITATSTQLAITFTAIPEPSTWALLLTGGGMLAWTLRRRRR